MSDKSRIVLTAGSGLQARLGNVAASAAKGARIGLRIGGEHVLGASNELVPWRRGHLARSGAVSQDDNGTTAISYNTPYAVAQHEEVHWQHDPGRQAKFLETALNKERDKVLQIVKAALKKELGL